MIYEKIQNKRIKRLKVMRDSMLLDSKQLQTALEIYDHSFVEVLTKRLRKTKIEYDKLYKIAF